MFKSTLQKHSAHLGWGDGGGRGNVCFLVTDFSHSCGPDKLWHSLRFNHATWFNRQLARNKLRTCERLYTQTWINQYLSRLCSTNWATQGQDVGALIFLSKWKCSPFGCIVVCTVPFVPMPAQKLGLFTSSIHLFLSFLCCLLKPVIMAIEQCLGTKSHTFLPRRENISPLSLKKITRKSIRAQKIAQRVPLHNLQRCVLTGLWHADVKHNVEFWITCWIVRIRICVLSIKGQFQALLILTELSAGISRR